MIIFRHPLGLMDVFIPRLTVLQPMCAILLHAILKLENARFVIQINFYNYLLLILHRTIKLLVTTMTLVPLISKFLFLFYILLLFTIILLLNYYLIVITFL